MAEYEPVIALEMHAQLKTETKMFCSCSAAYGAPPNTQVCPICLGLPGSLPKVNRRAVEFAMRIVLATGGQIHPESIFARKNYFYPDLPKGYQISQYEFPLATGGQVTIRTEQGAKQVGLIRIHLEEDAGKSLHETGNAYTAVDFNRCGVPLIEIVSEPDIKSPEEGHQFLLKLKQLVEYLDICTGNMEEGSLRCDANVSVRRKGETRFGTRCELKNMNSFRGVERALKYEIQRQIGLLEAGRLVQQQTLLWDEKAGVSHPMRVKEESHDYRYFPEPDLVPLRISQEWIEQVRADLPELPDARCERFVRQYGLPEYDAGVLTASRYIADYFETVTAICGDAKLSSNWVMTELLREVKQTDTGRIDLPPEHLGSLLMMIKSGRISGKMAKAVFADMIRSGAPPEQLIKEAGLEQITDKDALMATIASVLEANAESVGKYLSGKQGVFAFLVGQVMQKTKGQANPQLVNELLREALDKRRK